MLSSLCFAAIEEGMEDSGWEHRTVLQMNEECDYLEVELTSSSSSFDPIPPRISHQSIDPFFDSYDFPGNQCSVVEELPSSSSSIESSLVPLSSRTSLRCRQRLSPESSILRLRGGGIERRAHRQRERLQMHGCEGCLVWTLQASPLSPPNCSCPRRRGINSVRRLGLLRCRLRDSQLRPIPSPASRRFIYSYHVDCALPAIAERLEENDEQDDGVGTGMHRLAITERKSVPPPPPSPSTESVEDGLSQLAVTQQPVLSEDDMCARLSALPLGHHSTPSVTSLEGALAARLHITSRRSQDS